MTAFARRHTTTACPTASVRYARRFKRLTHCAALAPDAAAALVGADQIILPALPSPSAYLLTQVTELTITDHLTITGSGASTTIIDGNKGLRPNSGVLLINAGVTVSISRVTIQNGSQNARPRRRRHPQLRHIDAYQQYGEWQQRLQRRRRHLERWPSEFI